MADGRTGGKNERNVGGGIKRVGRYKEGRSQKWTTEETNSRIPDFQAPQDGNEPSRTSLTADTVS